MIKFAAVVTQHKRVMLEGFLENLLARYFGEYIDGLDASHLSVGLLSGEVSLQDLKLKVSALDELELPIRISAGFLRSLQIKVRLCCQFYCCRSLIHCHSCIQIPLNPWSTPVKIVLDGLYIVATPRQVPLVSAQHDTILSEIFQAELALKRKKVLLSVCDVG
jgi:hypothetical protein